MPSRPAGRYGYACAAGSCVPPVGDFAVWYVIQVMSGKEEAMRHLLGRMVPSSLLADCFTPRYETQMKVRGQWQTVTKVLFPGYLIVDTARVEDLHQALTRVPELTRLLTVGEKFVPLTDEEVAWISTFANNADHVVPMSTGVVEELADGDRIVVTAGPLKGHEALIKSVNRRKSLAFLEIEMFGRKMTTRVGLGIVAKRKHDDCVVSARGHSDLVER